MSSSFKSTVQPISGSWGNPSPDYFKKVTPNKDVFSPTVLRKDPQSQKENSRSYCCFAQMKLAKESAKAKELFFQHSFPTRAVSPVPRRKSPLSNIRLILEEQEEFSSPGLFPVDPSRDPSPFFLEKSYLSSFQNQKELLFPSTSPFPGSRTPSPLQLDETIPSLV